MTQHDPFTYGQVSLGTGSAKKPAAESLDDMLFADSGPSPVRKGSATDSGWDQLEAAGPGTFGGAQSLATDESADMADILNEKSTSPAPKPQPSAARPGTARPQPQMAAPAPRGAAAAPAAAPAAAKVVAPPPASSTAPRPMRTAHPLPPRPASIFVPLALLAGGAGLAAWLHFVHHNLVMAGIVGALSLVGAVFARVWLRG